MTLPVHQERFFFTTYSIIEVMAGDKQCSAKMNRIAPIALRIPARKEQTET